MNRKILLYCKLDWILLVSDYLATGITDKFIGGLQYIQKLYWDDRIIFKKGLYNVIRYVR